MTTATRWFSLRRRLTLWLLGGFTVGWVLLLAFSYAGAHHEIDELFDAQLVQSAQSLLALRGVERALRIDRADHAIIILRAELRLAQRLGLLSEGLLLRSLELCDQLGRQRGGWRRSLAAKSPPLDS